MLQARLPIPRVQFSELSIYHLHLPSLVPIVSMDYYRVLQVSRDASSAEIKAAYRKAALTCHPDRHASTGSADSQASMATKFAQITEAYETLSDVHRRRVYDRDGRSAAARDPTGASYWRQRGAATSSTWCSVHSA